ncbi:hypothetical protein BGZ82_005382, partial [Podila clonocystis]
MACKALMDMVQDGDTVTMKHTGFHNHAKPPPLRADVESKRSFKKEVRAAPEVRPLRLVIGSKTRKPVDEIHVKYADLEYTAKERKGVLQEERVPETIGALAAFEKDMD